MLNDKVVVITGGASGIGLASAKRLLKEGAKVALLDVNDDVLEISKELGANTLGLKCDVSNEADVKSSIDMVANFFGKIDYLVANAGIGGGANKPADVSIEEWNKVIGVNQTGIFLVNKYVIPHMIENGGGSIVNTSSMYGIVGAPNSFAYTASKGAINQMTRTLALAYAENNIRVNAIAPGFVDTAILSSVPDEYKKVMAKEMPIGRLGTDDEIASLVKFLLSDEASFITGAIISIDGGYTAK
ncbi:MAG: SDR family oxidoreductase [bacterium]|nr:SDR family oxidoreductase [bacterium]